MDPVGEPKVAVVGATGAVGNQIVDLIAARSFPHRQLELFATQAGASQTVDAAGEERLVNALSSPQDLSGFDLVFLAVPSVKAAEIIAAAPGPTLIDLSAASGSPTKVAMVAPGFTSRATIEQMRQRKLFAIPHPAALVLATCLKALDVKSGFVAATVMLGASAGGRDALATAVDQTTDLLSARLSLEEDEVQRGFNIFVREHERAVASVIAAQCLALLNQSPVLAVQALAVPVLHGSGLSIDLPWIGNGAEVMERMRAAPGVLINEEGEPLGLIDAVGQEAIVVSIEERPGSISLWCVFDNTRLAALDALWIAETLALDSTNLA